MCPPSTAEATLTLSLLLAEQADRCPLAPPILGKQTTRGPTLPSGQQMPAHAQAAGASLLG